MNTSKRATMTTTRMPFTVIILIIQEMHIRLSTDSPPASAIALRQQRRLTIRLHDTGMLAAQLAWLIHTTGMRDHPHFLHHGLHKIGHPLGFVGLHQPTLQLRIVWAD